MISMTGGLTIIARCDVCNKDYPLYSLEPGKQDIFKHKSAASIRRMADGRDVCSVCYTDKDGANRPFFHYLRSYTIHIEPATAKPVSLKEGVV